MSQSHKSLSIAAKIIKEIRSDGEDIKHKIEKQTLNKIINEQE